MFVKILRYIFLLILAISFSNSNVLAESKSMDFSIQLDEFIKIETISNSVLTANITDRTGNLYAPLTSIFKIISNTNDKKTLYLKATAITDSGIEEAMFNMGGRAYIAFANLAKKPTSRALTNCKMGKEAKSSPGVVAYPITSVSGTENRYNYEKDKYEVIVGNGTTYVTVNVGSNVLKTSFASNDPNGFYQATLSLTESDI